MTKDESLKLALEALEETLPYAQHALQDLEDLYKGYTDLQARKTRVEREDVDRCEKALVAIREALAAPQKSLKDMTEADFDEALRCADSTEIPVEDVEFGIAAPQGEPTQDIDWKDQYEKQKRRCEMWIAKYEKDIGPLEKAYPAAPAPLSESEIKKIAAEAEFAPGTPLVAMLRDDVIIGSYLDRLILICRAIERHVRGNNATS